MTISFNKSWPEIRKSEIPSSEFCQVFGNWGKLGIPYLARTYLIKCYWMLPNARVIAFTISELLRENQQGGGGGGKITDLTGDFLIIGWNWNKKTWRKPKTIAGDSYCSKPEHLIVMLYFYILYILYSLRPAITIFKINFAISIFVNFLMDVQLKWFHLKHRSHTTELVLIAIIFWQSEQNHFELFCYRIFSNILLMQNLSRFDKNHYGKVSRWRPATINCQNIISKL